MKRFIFAALITLVILLLSLSLGSKIVYDKEDLASIKFGFPLYFIDQDQIRHDPPYPYRVKIGSFYEDPVKINWTNLLMDILIVFILVKLIMNAINLRKILDPTSPKLHWVDKPE